MVTSGISDSSFIYFLPSKPCRIRQWVGFRHGGRVERPRLPNNRLKFWLWRLAMKKLMSNVSGIQVSEMSSAETLARGAAAA
jgi:hypothetical protein